MLITTHLTQIVKLIATNETTSIVAPTGSGKSVAVPAAIASLGGARCFVTVPTRTAAISLAEYQRVIQQSASPELSSSDVNRLVGYAAEGNVNYGKDTKVAYVTGGHARRKMLSYFSEGMASPIDFCDVLMVDEVHSGSLDTTIIISLWMKAASLGVLVPRLVIASATPVPIVIQPTPAVYTVEIAAFPIEYRYLTKDIDIDDNAGLYTEAAKIAADIHRNEPIDSGHILIFAPGSSEVESVGASLQELLKDQTEGKIATIIPAFGALKQEDIALIYKETEVNERKIVIATNIAEMSITITDVGHVIDTMVEKLAETSQSGGFRLATHYISKDSAKQRAGRTGRTRAGVCHRLCTQERYESLEEHRLPEIQRVPIYETVMELLDVGISPENVIKGIDSQRVIQAVKLLTRLGMVNETTGGIVVTRMGHFAPKFDISVRNAAFLWHWIQSGYPVFPGIVAAVLIDSYGPSYLWIPRRKSDMSVEQYNLIIKDYKEKYFTKYIGYNDLETCLNMWSDLMKTTGGVKASQSVIIKWARQNSINNKKIRELLKIVEQCINAATREGYTVQIGPFTTDGVMNAARPILLNVYSDVTLIHRRGMTYFSPVTKDDYRLDNRDAVNKLAGNPPKGVIALATAEIKTQRGSFRIIGFAVDTDKDIFGKPITNRRIRDIEHTLQPLSPRQKSATIPVSQNEQPDIEQALDLLARLNLSATTKTAPQRSLPSRPTQGLQPTEAFDLLATLQQIPTDLPPPIIVAHPTTFPQPVQSHKNEAQDVDAVLNLMNKSSLEGPKPYLDREYTRYWYINYMQSFIEKELNVYQVYETLNSLERWFIGLANITSEPDRIFSKEKLEVQHPLSLTFLAELERKEIPNAGIIVGTCISIALQYLELTTFEEAPTPERTDNTVKVGLYSRTLPSGRLDLLLSKSGLMDVAVMVLRYSCLMPRGQQWNIPLPIYEILVNKYGVTIEGFGSPINSQIIAVNPNLHFCSVFLDTDAPFGSLGSFFNQKLNNVKIMANPPYVPDVMNKMADFLLESFDTAINLTAFIIVPAWIDADFYNRLKETKYLKHSIQLAPNDHYYVDSNNNDAIIRSKFNSTLLILSKGYPDADYKQIESDIRAVYRKIRY